MRRRDFLTLAGAAAAFPVVAIAQSPKTRIGLALIGFLTNDTEQQSDVQSLGPFRRAMTDLGFVAGKDYVVEVRYGRGDVTKLPDLAKEFVALRPDLIVASDSSSGLVARQATDRIPIVSALGNLETSAALQQAIGSRAKPANNLTGISTNFGPLTGKHCDLALELVPSAKRIGVLAFPLGPDGGQGTRDGATAAATAHGVGLTIIDVPQPTDIGPAFRSLAANNVNVIVVGSGTVFAADRALTAQAATAVGIPTIYNEQGYVDAGGLLSYGFSREATITRLASFAQLVLQGAPISQIPVEETSTYIMAVNLKTAKLLGLTMPPTLLFRADIVIQ